VSRAEPKDSAGSPLRRLGLKQDSHLGEDLLESFAFVGQIPMQLADDTIPRAASSRSSSERLTGIDTARIEEGKIVESWSEADLFGMMTQLGVIPEPGQSEEAAPT